MLNTPRSLSSRYRWAYFPPPPRVFSFFLHRKTKKTNTCNATKLADQLYEETRSFGSTGFGNRKSVKE